jgi:hypothetical protein
MMKKGVIIALILVVMAGGVCWWKMYQAENSKRAIAEEFESDMMAGLLQGIFQELDADGPHVFFVAFGEDRAAPSDAFMRQFASHGSHVQILTEAVSTPNGLVFDKSSGQAGVIIQIISFHQFSPGGFDVLVALSNRPRGHDRFTYRLFNIGGNWQIASRKPP